MFAGKRTITIALALILLISLLSSCADTGSPDYEKHILVASVIEAGQSPLVEPVEGSWELASADRIYVDTQNMTDVQSRYTLRALRAGDTVRITYDGMIAETYPAQINGASEIRFTDASNHNIVYSWTDATVIKSEYSRPAVMLDQDSDNIYLIQPDYSNDPEVERLLGELMPDDRVSVCWCTVFDMSPQIIDVFRLTRIGGEEL